MRCVSVKKDNFMKKLTIFLIITFYFIYCSKRDKPNEPVIETINGIEYVHNQAEPLYPDRQVVFEEEFSITGEDSETGEIYLFRPAQFTVDNDENIFVNKKV